MEFRLKSKHYILDRELEPDTLVSPPGFRLYVGLDGAENPIYAPLQPWIPGEAKMWNPVPSMEMEPKDDEAKKLVARRTDHRADPIAAISLKVQ